MKRLLPATIAFVLTVAALVPSALSLPQHGDEKMYIWKAAYYGSRIAQFDFSQGTDTFLDPGMSPWSFWALEQPMGSHLIYSAALGVSGAATPTLPYSWTDTNLQGPDTAIPDATLPLVRFVAIACAAVGSALISLRFGWRGLVATGLMIAIPHARDDLARAWAEGPLLLGFGMCAVAHGSRWFALVTGVAATLKLTVVALWPLVFLQGVGKSRFARVLAVIVAAGAWSVLTPPSWLMGGPLYLAMQLLYRVSVYSGQSADIGGPAGFFLPTRYLWPVELALLLGATVMLPRLWLRSRAKAEPRLFRKE